MAEKMMMPIRLFRSGRHSTHAGQVKMPRLFSSRGVCRSLRRPDKLRHLAETLLLGNTLALSASHAVPHKMFLKLLAQVAQAETDVYNVPEIC